MPTSANYFYDFLEHYILDKEALIYFGLYADVRNYIRFCEEGHSEYELKNQAEQIYKDYVNVDREWNIYIK